MTNAFRISLFANLGLLALVGVLLLRRGEPATATPARGHPLPSSTQANATTPTPRSDTSAAESHAPQISRAAISELEQLGIPRAAIAQALVQDFSRRWDQRMMALQKKYAPKMIPPREELELSRQREAEQIAELKAALGEEGYLAWDQERTVRLLNLAAVPMSDDEAAQAYRLQKEFDRKHTELQIAMEDGLADQADAVALQRRAEQELAEQLERLLGPERFNAIRGQADPVAEVTWKLAHLNPTRDQAQRVLETEAAFAAREAALANALTGDAADAGKVATELKTLHEAREARLAEIFGAETYLTLQRQNDRLYQDLQHYAGAWNLEPQEVHSVYDTLDAFHDAAERTRAAAQLREATGQRVNWREINAGIEQSRRQTEAGLQTLLGPDRLRRLKQNGLLSVR